MYGTSWIQASLLAVVLSAALAAPAGAATPDAWITTKTKLALLTTEGVSGTAIKVDTVLGRVTLHGKVGSTEEKTKAETITQKIEGVKSVHNLLQVVAPQHEKAMQVSDDALKQRIEQALQADPSLKSSQITVRSVNQGVVLLGGTAKTLSAHLRAIEVVAIIPGVRRVASEVQSPETLADAEIWRESPPPPPGEGYGVWDTASDIWITSATKMRLLADSQTPALDINVDTWEGVVTLFGIVPSPEAKAAAEADARKVSGVKRVENELQVVASAKQAAGQVRDEELERAVKQAFDTPDLKDISIEVKNGVNAIQIMPVAQFAGERSWGYNPAHIFSVEIAYGGPLAFKKFVKRAHQQGIAVILDVVYNHLGPSDLDLWQFDGWSENNRGGIYFYNDGRAHTPWGDTRPDYGRGEVRQYICDNVFMWLEEYHVDGLRFDGTVYIRTPHGPGSDDLPEGWSLLQWINSQIS